MLVLLKQDCPVLQAEGESSAAQKHLVRISLMAAASDRRALFDTQGWEHWLLFTILSVLSVQKLYRPVHRNQCLQFFIQDLGWINNSCQQICQINSKTQRAEEHDITLIPKSYSYYAIDTTVAIDIILTILHFLIC